MSQNVNISTINTISRESNSPLRPGTECRFLLLLLFLPLLTLREVLGLKQGIEAEHLLLTLHSWDLHLWKVSHEELLDTAGQRRLAREKGRGKQLF